MVGRRLTRSFFARDSESVAHDLIGCVLVRELPDGGRLTARIVETEAYVGVEDRASHAFAGRRTARNEAMYAKPGTSYVYFTYGMHWCFNVVCGEVDDPIAVLVRAAEPMSGLETMRTNRVRLVPDHELCRGPANLCKALCIGPRQNGIDLATSRELFLRGPARPARAVERSPRIGIDLRGTGLNGWASKPLRFSESGEGGGRNRSVSGPNRKGDGPSVVVTRSK